MVYTNRLGFPEEIYWLIVSTNEKYSAEADYSVTELIDSPKRVRLTKRYSAEIKTDVSDLWPSFVGNIIHEFMEHEGKGGLRETRFFTEVLGHTVSGMVDKLQDCIITDYKSGLTSSLYKFPHPEWEPQLNLYACLLRRNKHPVEGLVIQPIAYDWRDGFDKLNYSPVQPIEITMWDDTRAECYLVERVQTHIDCESAFDSRLPDCTPAEMWEKEARWAVESPDRKRAIRVFDTEKEAIDFAFENDSKYPRATVVHRPGGRTRCEGYCFVNRWCNQHKEHKNDS